MKEENDYAKSKEAAYHQVTLTVQTQDRLIKDLKQDIADYKLKG